MNDFFADISGITVMPEYSSWSNAQVGGILALSTVQDPENYLTIS